MGDPPCQRDFYYIIEIFGKVCILFGPMGGGRCEDCVSRMVGFAKLKEGEGKMIGRFHEMGRAMRLA